MIVTNQDTNANNEMVTTEAGLFTATYLPAGTYSIEVDLPGFATFRRTGSAADNGAVLSGAVRKQPSAVVDQE